MHPSFYTDDSPGLENFAPTVSKLGLSIANAKYMVNCTSNSAINSKHLNYSFKIKYQKRKDAPVYEWIINRCIQEFQDLHQNLLKEMQKGNLASVPRLPNTDNLSREPLEEQLERLESYLKDLSQQRDTISNPKFWEFFEVSSLSFEGVKQKWKEGYVLKRTGGQIGNERRFFNCAKYCKRLQKRWMIIRNDMVGYLKNNSKSSLNEVLMFKGRFEVLYGEKDTGYEDGVKIITLRRTFIFRAGSALKRDEWVKAIVTAYNESEWNRSEQRFDSSFPLREQNEVTWYVDGKSYFNEVFEYLKRAKREVFISDWWLSPDLYLKRPAKKYEKSQVVEILGMLADRGVSVFIHVYKEVTFALTLNSMHTKTTLLNRNPNIKVIRHPHRSVVGGEFLWSHHEKLVCIDQEIAFMGGLDLCYGRYDTNKHPLVDHENIFNGIDYSNARISDFYDVHNWNRDLINREINPRMPWHDVALRVIGKSAADIGLHFIELWNHVMTDITTGYHKNKNLLQPVHSSIINEQENESDSESISSCSSEGEEETKKPAKVLREKKLSLAVETFKEIAENRRASNRRSSFNVNGKRINVEFLNQRMEMNSELNPGIAVAIDKKEALKKMQTTVDENSKSLLANIDIDNEIPTVLKRRSTVHNIDFEFQRKQREKIEMADEEKMIKEIEEEQVEGDENFSKMLLLPKIKELGQTGTCDCQLLRSAGLWSLGLEETEHSIHTAYLNLIDQADHFIYIENQFFISCTAGETVKNQIAQALVERIKIAAEKKEPFKVIVVLPLLPGFEGAVDDSSASVLRVQLHWEYQTICRGQNSIYEQLKRDPNISDPADYIRFYGLRAHAVLGDRPVTEIVYVHSKLMIVDDDIVLMGSANINDRSQLGNHDSEIAMIVTDKTKVQSTLAGKPRAVSQFAYTLRTSIFKEHLGVESEELLRDPLSEQFTNEWISTAARNTNLYREVFRCYPDDYITSIAEIPDFENEAHPEKYNDLKDVIKGFLVDFPLDFLKFEDLRIPIFTKEYVIPDDSFV